MANGEQSESCHFPCHFHAPRRTARRSLTSRRSFRSSLTHVTQPLTSFPPPLRLGTSDGVKDERRNERRDREVGTEGSGSEVGYEDE